MHSQYDNDLLGHLIPSIHNTASLFPNKIDILNSIYWPPIALLYHLIKQSGNCYAFLKISCCHSSSLHYSPFLANLQWKTLFLGKTVISPHFVPGSVVEEEQPNYSAGDGNYFCVTCNLCCCSCNICTCSSSSLIRRSRFANCFLKSFSSSHCREYALCNCNKMSYNLLDYPSLFAPESKQGDNARAYP